jgi:hypothetical protein
MRSWLGLAVIVLFAAAFLVGRGSAGTRQVPARGSFDAGYLAGREAAFAGYDGGWAYDAPYIVFLRPGGPGITYRVARRLPLMPGFEYRVCGGQVCLTAVH